MKTDMKTALKNLRRANPAGAEKLSAMELNAIHFSTRHTVLTPKKLEDSTAGDRDAPAATAGIRKSASPEVNIRLAPEKIR